MAWTVRGGLEQRLVLGYFEKRKSIVRSHGIGLHGSTKASNTVGKGWVASRELGYKSL